MTEGSGVKWLFTENIFAHKEKNRGLDLLMKVVRKMFYAYSYNSSDSNLTSDIIVRCMVESGRAPHDQGPSNTKIA